jgi:hypothetical protein
MPDTGPYITAAFVCERTLQEQDGALSAIRIIDRITFPTTPDGKLVQPRQAITFVIMLKSGQARGTYTVSITQEMPSGQQVPFVEAPVLLEGEDRGVNLILSGAFEPDQAGLYWWDVSFDGSLLTRIPLRAVFLPLPAAPGP